MADAADVRPKRKSAGSKMPEIMEALGKASPKLQKELDKVGTPDGRFAKESPGKRAKWSDNPQVKKGARGKHHTGKIPIEYISDSSARAECYYGRVKTAMSKLKEINILTGAQIVCFIKPEKGRGGRHYMSPVCDITAEELLGEKVTGRREVTLKPPSHIMKKQTTASTPPLPPPLLPLPPPSVQPAETPSTSSAPPAESPSTSSAPPAETPSTSSAPPAETPSTSSAPPAETPSTSSVPPVKRSTRKRSAPKRPSSTPTKVPLTTPTKIPSTTPTQPDDHKCPSCGIAWNSPDDFRVKEWWGCQFVDPGGVKCNFWLHCSCMGVHLQHPRNLKPLHFYCLKHNDVKQIKRRY